MLRNTDDFANKLKKWHSDLRKIIAATRGHHLNLFHECPHSPHENRRLTGRNGQIVKKPRTAPPLKSSLTAAEPHREQISFGVVSRGSFEVSSREDFMAIYQKKVSNLLNVSKGGQAAHATQRLTNP
ncbi:MAG: hypothetical protein V3R99_08730 [Thermoguttaceae bacterium]